MKHIFIFSSLLFYALIILFLFSIGCGKDEESSIIPKAEELVSQGWKEYSAGNYKDAIGKYQDALQKDPDVIDAYNGMGWSMARLGEIRNAIDSLKKAAEKEHSNPDIHTGLSGVYFASDDYERAIASAKLALSLDPQYKSHHDDITAYDVRILMAECYFIMGNYSDAKAQIDILGGASRNLDPASPTYKSDLISVINELAKKGTLTSLGFIKKSP